eukprot:3635626-Rhodomonas_salina.2
MEFNASVKESEELKFETALTGPVPVPLASLCLTTRFNIVAGPVPARFASTPLTTSRFEKTCAALSQLCASPSPAPSSNHRLVRFQCPNHPFSPLWVRS